MSELRRDLGLVSAVMVTVGSVIGSGIFMKPLDIARHLPGPAWVYLSWAGLGVVCLCGALTYAELSTRFPEAGGQYTFLREGWGRFVAFLYGWCLFLVINTGTLSALAVAFADSLSRLVPLEREGQILVAAGMILGLAVVNHIGVRWGGALQNLSTLAKLGSLGAIVVLGYLIGRPPTAPPPAGPPSPSPLAGFTVAAVALFWAYEGWHQLPFNAAELTAPRRQLPRGLILGVLTLIAVYLIVNAAYFHLVPYEEMRTLRTEIDVPVLAMERIFGPAGRGLLAVMLCLSVLGAANPNLLSTPRAFYAMARDGLALPPLRRVHPRFGTPHVAIWTQAVWGVVLVLVLKTFRDLTEYVIFAGLIFYALGVAAVYPVRRRGGGRPDAHRTWGYPVTPALFVAVVLFVEVNTLLDPTMRRNALYGLIILGAGVPVYFFLRRRFRPGGAPGLPDSGSSHPHD